MHGKVNMVPSRGTCTLLASYRGRGYEARGVGVQNGGLQERACNLCVLEPTPGQKPHRPALGTRGSAGPCLATSCCHPPRPRASPATPPRTRDPGFSFCRGSVDLGGETPVPDTAPLHPTRRPGRGKPDHRTAAAAAKETFSPEQPGSSALRQRSLRAPSLLFSKQAPWLSRDVRLLGDWARVPHMEAPLLEPLGLECSAALTQPDSPLGGLCPSLPEPPSHFSCSQFLSRAHS